MHTSAVLPATPAAALRLWDFSNEVCHFMKIIIAESNPDAGLLTQLTLILALASTLWLVTIKCQ